MSRAAKAVSRATELMASPSAVLSILLIYVVFHAALRLMISETIEVDHVEQAIFSQTLAWVYGLNQPPLYTWLQWSVNQIAGVSVASFILVKYAFFLAMWVIYYAIARRVLGKTVWAGVATLSLLLLYQIGWKIHLGVTHTAMVMFACAATLLVVLHLVERGGSRSVLDYMLLGLAVGIGMMSKYGYFLFLFALIASAMMQSGVRQVLLDRRALITVGVALMLFSPLGIAIADAAFAGQGPQTASSGGFAGYLSGLGPALGQLFLSVLAFLMPMAVVVPALALSALRMKPRISILTSNISGGTGTFDRGRLLLHLQLLILGFLLVLVLVGAMTGFKERWMHPFLMFAPILVVLWIKNALDADLERTRKFLQRFIIALVCLTALVLVFRVGQGFFGPPFCNRCRVIVPLQSLTTAVVEAGFKGGVIIAQNEHIGGNLRPQFPASSVHVPNYRFFDPGDSRETTPLESQQCVIAWQDDAERSGGLPAALATFAKERAGITVSPGTTGVPVDVIWAYGGKRPDFHWRFLIFRPRQQGCSAQR